MSSQKVLFISQGNYSLFAADSYVGNKSALATEGAGKGV